MCVFYLENIWKASKLWKWMKGQFSLYILYINWLIDPRLWGWDILQDFVTNTKTNSMVAGIYLRVPGVHPMVPRGVPRVWGVYLRVWLFVQGPRRRPECPRCRPEGPQVYSRVPGVNHMVTGLYPKFPGVHQMVKEYTKEEEQFQDNWNYVFKNAK